MAMHQGLDLSRFKKISSDGKTTTLLHTKGHEIKIAHGVLSPKMRDHINNMPVHLAEEGDVPAPVEAPDEDPNEAPEASAQEPAPAPAVPPAQDPDVVQVVGQKQPQSQFVGFSPEEKAAEHGNYEADLANGQIQPKTYHDLFADKGTLGKIGTLFGLLVSGAGSGLAHQPNMLMDMMNKELDRDLKKQEFNKENARNFLSLQYQHNLQQAQIAAHQQEILSKQVTTAKEAAATSQYLKDMGVPQAANFMNDYNSKAQEIYAPFEAKAKMLATVGHHLDTISQNNPAAANVAQNIVKPAIAAETAQTLGKGSAAVQAHAQNNRGRQSIVDENALGQAIRKGQNTPQGFAYQPGAINPSDVPKLQEEKGNLELNRNGAYDWNDSFNKLYAMKHAGQAPGVAAGVTTGASVLGSIFGPIGAGVAGGVGNVVGKMTQGAFERERNIQKEALTQRIGKDLSHDDREALVDSLLPSWNDSPESAAEAHRKGVQHFQSLEKSPVLDTYANQIPGLKSPFPNLPLIKPKAPKKQNAMGHEEQH